MSYNPLWRLLKGLNINKMTFAKSIDISNATLAKLGKNEPVTLTVIEKICKTYNCKIENVVKYIPDVEVITSPIEELEVGTIIVCSCYPIGTYVMQKYKSGISKKQHCVILKTFFEDGYSPKLLVAPLLYEEIPDTILDIFFRDLELNNEMISKGYIEIGKAGYIFQKDFETILGVMPSIHVEKAIAMLDKLQPIISFE